MNKKFTKLLSVFILAGVIGTGAAFAATGCQPMEDDPHQTQTDAVTGVTVKAAGDATTVANGGTLQMSAEVTGTGNYATTVTWSIKSGATATGATIDPNSGLLSAGTVAGEVTVVATSTADNTKKGELKIKVQPAGQPPVQDKVTSVTVKAAGNATTVANGGTLQMSAEVTGTGNYATTVTWSIKSGATATGATIDPDSGLLSAGTVAGDVTVVATSTADNTKKGELKITVQPAQPQPAEYEVTFKNEDGTVLNTGKLKEGQTPVYDGETPTKPATAQYTYTFSGWTDGEKEYASTDKLPEVTGNVTYTAMFGHTVNTYTYTFYDEDGTTELKKATVDYGTAIEKPADPTKPATAQYTYTFSGWTDGKNEYAPTDELPTVTGNITYTAKFDKSVNQYTYTFYDEDGTTELKKATVDYGTAIEKPAAPTKADTAEHKYHFDGWYTEKVGGTEITDFGKVIGDVTYYAHYTEVSVNEFHVIFNMNGHGANKNVSTVDKKVTELTPAPEADGYTFDGWYTNDGKDGDWGVAFDFTQEITADNTNIYAKWTAIKYTITYEEADGTAIETDNPAEYTIESETITLSKPAKNGYTFNWKNEKGETVTEIAKGTFGNIKLTAKWDIETYTITYDLVDGTNAEGNPATYTVEDAVTLKDPAKDGYTFGGWKNEKGETVTEIVKGSTGDLTLTADWKVIKYTITYDLVDGTNATENPAEYTIESETITLKDPAKDGYTFGGWKNEKGETVTEIAKGSTGNLKLTADWEVIKYTITYDLVDGTNAKENPAEYTIESETITLKDPTKDGYTFGGWKNEKGETVTEIAKGSTGNLKLTATWKLGKMSYDSWKKIFTDTAAIQDYTITMKLPGAGPNGEDLVMGLVKADKEKSSVYIRETVNGQLQDSYREYGETGTREYFLEEGNWYYRTIKDGTTYDSYVANRLENHLNIAFFSSENVYNAVEFDEKSGYSYTDAQEGAVYRFTFVNGLVSVIDGEVEMGSSGGEGGGTAEGQATETSNVMKMRLDLTEVDNTEVTLPEGAVEYSKYAVLAARDDNRIAEDFTTTTTLAQFTDWGTKGVYAKTGSEAEKITIVDGQAKGENTSKLSNISLMVDFGYVEGVVEGCFEFKFLATPGSANGNSVNFYNGESKILTIMGHKAGAVYTIENIPGVTTLPMTTITCDTTSLVKVEYKFDLINKTLTLKLNDESVCENLPCGITNVSGFEVVTSNSGQRGIVVDNIAVNGTDMSVETARTIYSGLLNGKLSSMTKAATETEAGGTHLINADGVKAVCEEGQTAIGNEQTVEAVIAAYKSAVAAMDNYESDKVITEARTAALTTVSGYSADNYTIADLTDGNAIYNNKADFEAAVKTATDAIGAAKSTADIDKAVADLKLALEGDPAATEPVEPTVKDNGAMIAAKQKEACDALTNYKKDEITALTDENIKTQIGTEKTNGDEALKAINVEEGVTAAQAIANIDTKLAEIKADIDTLISNVGQTAAAAKGKAKTDLTGYTKDLTDLLDQTADAELIKEINGVRDTGLGEIDKIADSEPASTVTETLNAQERNVYRAYSVALYKKYVAEVKSGIKDKDPAIDLDTGAPAVPDFATATSDTDVDTALETAKTEYDEYVAGELAKKEYTITFTYNGAEIADSAQKVVYGKTIDQTKIKDPVTGDNNLMLKGWKKDGADFALTTEIYGNVTLTAVVVEAVYHEAVSNSFDYDVIPKKADGGALTQEDFNGTANEFLKIQNNTDVVYRTSNSCIQNVNGGLKVYFANPGTISIKFASTGGKNTSFCGLRKDLPSGEPGAYLVAITPEGKTAPDGTALVNEGFKWDAASTNDTGKTISESDYGAYAIHATTAHTIEYTVTEAGWYTIYCSNASTGRGARILAVNKTENGYKTEKIAVTDVEISGDTKVEVGKTVTLTATVKPEDASVKDVTWAITAGNEYATIDETTGVITGVAAGTITVTVTTKDGNLKATYEVTVTKVDVTSVTISRQDGEPITGITIKTGTLQLEATVAPDNASLPNVTWTSSKPEVATVDENGLVTYVGVGETTITATADGVNGTVTIKCEAQGVESVSISGATEVNIGEKITLTATITPTDASNQNVTWSVADGEDGGQATIDAATGELTGVAAGTVTVTVTTEDGGKTATHTVTVNKIAVDSIKVADDCPNTVNAGDKIQLSAKAVGANNATPSVTTLKWEITVGGEYASINAETGELTGKAQGSVTVKVSSTDDATKFAEIGVTVNAAPTYSSWALDFAGTDKPTSTIEYSDNDIICDVLTVKTAKKTKLNSKGYLTTQNGSAISFEVKATANLYLLWNATQTARTYVIKDSDGNILKDENGKDVGGHMNTDGTTHTLASGIYTIEFAGGEHKITKISLTYSTT